MKKYSKIIRKVISCGSLLLLIFLGTSGLRAQDSTSTKVKHQKSGEIKPIKNTFEGNFILDNQTVMVPQKNSLEFDFQHRFGVVTNGYKDLAGLFGDANIRLGMGYTPISNLLIGFGINKYNLTWDFNAKYALMRQSQNNKGWPLSITIYANIAVDTRSKDNFVNGVDRLSYFGQLLVARKFTKNFSVQIAGNLSYFNNVPGYIDQDGKQQPLMDNYLISISASGRYKVSEKIAILLNYDQPLTRQISNNPHPNLSAGIEFVTSGHDFQVTFGNYQAILPQINNFYNQNDYQKGQFCIGFNILRLWHL